MQFDDRLNTVLRHRASGENAARIQFRQLLDLLGTWPRGLSQKHLAAAWLRMGALGEFIPSAERAKMITEMGGRFRNPELLFHLAEDEPAVAAAALSSAALSDDDWAQLIPRLPIRAQIILRERATLSDATSAILHKIGIHNQALPRPAGTVPEEADNADHNDAPETLAVEPAPPVKSAARSLSSIGLIVERIENFQRNRRGDGAGGAEKPDPNAPRLPLGDVTPSHSAAIAHFAFRSNYEGRIIWAERRVAAMVIGMRLDGDIAKRALMLRLPVRSASMTLAGADAISGDWVVDARPHFCAETGQFRGYMGMFRRPPARTSAEVPPALVEEVDRLRQLLHELRTPAGAIQGFAEVIQQQVLGHVPHEYRAVAANIASDGARILAGFEEIDRLARLESKVMGLDAGSSELHTIVMGLLTQIAPSLAARTSEIDYQSGVEPNVAITKSDCEGMIWRLLATIAGATGAAEQLALRLTANDEVAVIACDLPMALLDEDDIFAATTKANVGTLTAGMFNAGISLRLVRAEARAAGGAFERRGDGVVLRLPLFTDRRSQTRAASAA